MKKLISTFIVVFCMTFIANAQTESNETSPCSLQVDVKVDEFTGVTTKTIQLPTVKDSKNKYLLGSIVLTKGKYYLVLLYSGNIGCRTKESYVIIKFEDASTMHLTNFLAIDCSGEALGFKLDDSRVSILKEKKVKKIRICYESHEDLDLFDNEYFMAALKCLNSY